MAFTDQIFSVPLSNHRVWSAEMKSGNFAEAADGSREFTITGITCHLYEKGVETMLMTADTARATTVKDAVRMELAGNVTAVAKKQRQRLRASSLRWDSTENRIHAKQFTLLDDQLELHAAEGTFPMDFMDAEFSGGFRAVHTEKAR